MHVVLAHPWLIVLAVLVALAVYVVLAPFAVRVVRRTNRKINSAIWDVQSPAPNPTAAPASKETPAA